MAPDPQTRERRVDTTPYLGCGIVALVFLVLFFAALVAVWNVGGSVKHWFAGVFPALTAEVQQNVETTVRDIVPTGIPTLNPEGLLNEAQRAVTEGTQRAGEAATQGATDAVNGAVEGAVRDGAGQLRELLP